MTDRTPHQSERRTPEDPLDALLAGNRVELLATMTRALDTDAGLRALAPLRTYPPTKIEDSDDHSTTSPTHRPDAVAAHEDQMLSLEENPSVAIKMINIFTLRLKEVQRSPGLPERGATACVHCAGALRSLAAGLERRSVTRGEAMDLLAEAEARLSDLETAPEPPSQTWGDPVTRRVIALTAEQLKALKGVVVRMFDDAYDNIPIEN
ncbi:hypothetical protein ACFYZ5_43765 [Streptomyces chartreusis]|uniref:hypothetical protein n=1 Tax=Streptomyces chartreusis TaxID=1969 RepID=UPI0036B64DCD